MDPELSDRFIQTMRSWLVSLPFDLKILYEASTDENLSRETRELMIGAIISTISPTDLISDRENYASYAGDCVLLRLALKKGLNGDDEDQEFFRSRFSEFFETLDDELSTCEKVMGDIYYWLASKVDTMPTRTYKNKSVKLHFESEELQEVLYEVGMEFRTEYPVNEDDIADRLKKVSSILDLMKRAKNEDERKRASK